jgi:hypothetical protein
MARKRKKILQFSIRRENWNDTVSMPKFLFNLADASMNKNIYSNYVYRLFSESLKTLLSSKDLAWHEMVYNVYVVHKGKSPYIYPFTASSRTPLLPTTIVLSIQPPGDTRKLRARLKKVKVPLNNVSVQLSAVEYNNSHLSCHLGQKSCMVLYFNHNNAHGVCIYVEGTGAVFSAPKLDIPTHWLQWCRGNVAPTIWTWDVTERDIYWMPRRCLPLEDVYTLKENKNIFFKHVACCRLANTVHVWLLFEKKGFCGVVLRLRRRQNC